MNYRPAIVTRVDLSSDRTIGSGNSITVFYILVSNSSDSPVEVDFQYVGGTNAFRLVCPAKDSRPIEVEFVADKGLIIDAPAQNGSDTVVSIWHSQEGS